MHHSSLIIGELVLKTYKHALPKVCNKEAMAHEQTLPLETWRCASQLQDASVKGGISHSHTSKEACLGFCQPPHSAPALRTREANSWSAAYTDTTPDIKSKTQADTCRQLVFVTYRAHLAHGGQDDHWQEMGEAADNVRDLSHALCISQGTATKFVHYVQLQLFQERLGQQTKQGLRHEELRFTN